MHDMLSSYLYVVQPVPERVVLLSRASSERTRDFILFTWVARITPFTIGLGST